MPDNKPEMVKTPEPYHLIIPQSLFKAIKYNQAQIKDRDKITKEEEKEYYKFKNMFKDFMARLNAGDPSAFSILSAIMGMWGYTRKYCGMCGKPIIGKPGHIQNRMVCATCDESYRIAEEIHKKEDKPVQTVKRVIGRKTVEVPIQQNKGDNTPPQNLS